MDILLQCVGIVGVSHTIAVVDDTEFSWLNFFKNAGIPDDDAVQYVELFEDNRIKKNMLLELNKTILQDMGINMAGDTIAILRHAKIVHAQEMRKNSAAKTSSVKSSNSCPSLGKAFSKRSAINEINEWIKVPGKTQLVKKESYETKQYSADSNRTVTKVSLRSSPELSSGIGLGQWGLNVTKKKRTAMDTGSSPPPERYEKTGQDSVSRKRTASDIFTDTHQTQQSKRHQTADPIREAELPGSSQKSSDDPVDAHHSVFERLDHSGNANKLSAQLKAASTPQPAKDFEEQLHHIALTAVMECLQKQSTPSTGNKPNSAALPTRRSQPELKQTSDVTKSDTFDKLTEINTSRERHKITPPSQSTKKPVSPSSIPRKVKLRMDTISEATDNNRGKSKVDIMTRLGKQSVFTRLTN